jgi:hypothetical protein
VKANELTEATLGGALWSKFKDMGSAQGKLSLKDRMIQKQFVDDLAGRAATNLAQGIEGGLVDPNPTAGMQPASPPPQPQAQQPQAGQQQQPAQAQTPTTPTAPTNNSRAAGANVRNMMKQRAFNKATTVKEAQGKYAYSISSYLQNFLKKYMPKVDSSTLKPMCDAVQSTYTKDGGKQALQKLASAAFSLYWTAGGGAGAHDMEPADQAAGPTSVGDALKQGFMKGLGQGSDQTTATGTQTAKAPEEVKSVYKQVKGLMNQLNKRQKGYILNSLQKEIGSTSDTATSEPGAGAFSQMARQLPGAETTSTGGTTTPSATGVTHKAGKGNKVKQKASGRTRAKVAQPVSENKSYKIWGQK